MSNMNEIDCISFKPVEDFEIIAADDLYTNLWKTRFLRRHRVFRQKFDAGVDCPHHVSAPEGLRSLR
jgi:hypothetical protein